MDQALFHFCAVPADVLDAGASLRWLFRFLRQFVRQFRGEFRRRLPDRHRRGDLGGRPLDTFGNCFVWIPGVIVSRPVPLVRSLVGRRQGGGGGRFRRLRLWPAARRRFGQFVLLPFHGGNQPSQFRRRLRSFFNESSADFTAASANAANASRTSSNSATARRASSSAAANFGPDYRQAASGAEKRFLLRRRWFPSCKSGARSATKNCPPGRRCQRENRNVSRGISGDHMGRVVTEAQLDDFVRHRHFVQLDFGFLPDRQASLSRPPQTTRPAASHSTARIPPSRPPIARSAFRRCMFQKRSSRPALPTGGARSQLSSPGR